MVCKLGGFGCGLSVDLEEATFFSAKRFWLDEARFIGGEERSGAGAIDLRKDCHL
jgi:hypothetical protein